MKLRTILSAPPGAPFADALLAAADEMEHALIGQCAGAGPYRAALEDLLLSIYHQKETGLWSTLMEKTKRRKGGAE